MTPRTAIAIVCAITACGGEAFTIDALDAAATDATSNDDAGDAGDAASTSDTPPKDDAATLADAGLADRHAGEGGLCCMWMDAGANFTWCGPNNEWTCVDEHDGGNRTYELCSVPPVCEAGPCVLSNEMHGVLVFGVITACP